MRWRGRLPGRLRLGGLWLREICTISFGEGGREGGKLTGFSLVAILARDVERDGDTVGILGNV